MSDDFDLERLAQEHHAYVSAGLSRWLLFGDGEGAMSRAQRESIRCPRCDVTDPAECDKPFDADCYWP